MSEDWRVIVVEWERRDYRIKGGKNKYTYYICEVKERVKIRY